MTDTAHGLDLFDTSAEELGLLSALLRDPDRAADLLDELDSSELTTVGEAWALASRLVSQGRTPDVRALHREAAGSELRGAVETVLKRGMLTEPDGVPVAERVGRIREVRRRQRLHQAGLRLAHRASDPAAELDAATERALEDLTGTDTDGRGGPRHIGEVMRGFLEAQRSVSADRIVRTPWDALNGMLGGGLHRGRVYVVAGSTGSGKSNVGLALAGHAAAKRSPTLVCSVEMSELEVAGRWFSRTAGVDLGEVTGYRLDGRATAAATELAGTQEPLWVDDRPHVTAGQVHATARRLRRKAGLRLVVVDYVQLLDAEDRRVARYEQIGAMSRRLKLMARDLDAAVVVLAQLNRAPAARSERRPRKEDLREGAALEHDSDVVILLHHRSELHDGSTIPTFEVELIVDKNRHNPTGSVLLGWRGELADLR